LVGIESDYLFPLTEQKVLHQYLPNNTLKIIDSDYGHDGFLIEFELLQDIIQEILH